VSEGGSPGWVVRSRFKVGKAAAAAGPMAAGLLATLPAGNQPLDSMGRYAQVITRSTVIQLALISYTYLEIAESFMHGL
jgi:hypothetical protein